MFLKNSKYLPFAGHGSVFVFNMLQAVGESSDGRSVYKQQGGDNFLFYLVKTLANREWILLHLWPMENNNK